MRILHVISSVDPAGGGPIECIRQLSAQLAILGHDAEIASLDGPDADFLLGCPLQVHALGPGLSPYQYSSRLVPWLRQAAPQYDVVLIHGLWQYHSFAVWRALRSYQGRYFVFPHGMLDPWFKRRYPLKHLKKWMFWPWSDYRVLRDAQAVIFTCEQERALARKSFWLYQATERIAPLGTRKNALSEHDLREMFLDAHPQIRDRRTILFLGRVHPKKGCDLLIKAFAALADSDEKLLLAFAGPVQSAWKSDLERLARRFGLAERIAWLGMLQGDMKWGALYACDVFMLPSHQENFGIAVIEALACRRAVLVSDKVNIWKEIADDGAGFVDDDTVQGTTRMLERWLRLSAAEKSVLRERAFACFERRFKSEVAASRLAEILTSAPHPVD
jgi:glycosyltransferase involved in cell wall biosynthesis